MSEKRRKPTERQKNCSYSFPYMGENFDKVYCSKKVEDDIVAVSGEECESCIQFKNKHIQYPIEVNKIKYEPLESIRTRNTSSHYAMCERIQRKDLSWHVFRKSSDTKLRFL